MLAFLQRSDVRDAPVNAAVKEKLNRTIEKSEEKALTECCGHPIKSSICGLMGEYKVSDQRMDNAVQAGAIVAYQGSDGRFVLAFIIFESFKSRFGLSVADTSRSFIIKNPLLVPSGDAGLHQVLTPLP